MNVLDNLTETALCRYFNTLSYLGYIKYEDVYKLLILIYIDSFMIPCLYEYLTEDDIRYIDKALSRLYNSTCLIDIPDNHIYDSLIHEIKEFSNYKYTEDNIIRSTQNMDLRKI